MRDAFSLDPSIVHLNHGSFGAVPRVVTEAQQRVRDRAESNPMRFHRVEAPHLKEQARAVAGEFLGVGSDDVALVRNVTQAIAVVLASLAHGGRLGPGDTVVVSQQGYAAVNRSVVRWCEQTGASYQVVHHPVDSSADAVVAGFERAFDEVRAAGGRVRLVVADQVTAPTGSVLPVARICASARAVGALSFVDAAHVPGQLPAEPARTGADYWSGTWHKWGFAPRGTTALWVAEAERAQVMPVTTSWNHEMPFPWPFDTYGTDDCTGWYCLADAVGFWRDAGGAEIAAGSSAVLDEAVEMLSSVLHDDAAPVPLDPAPCLRVLPLPVGVATTPEDAAALYERLSEHRVETQVTPYDGHGFIRLSGALYNELSDYERLAEVLPAALPG